MLKEKVEYEQQKTNKAREQYLFNKETNKKKNWNEINPLNHE